MKAAATFTLNEHYFSDHPQKFLEPYCNEGVGEYAGGEEDLGSEDLVARDRFEPAQQTMASVQGYFHGKPTNALPIIKPLMTCLFSFKRFTNMVPMAINQELLRDLDWNRGICAALIEGLEVAGSDSFERPRTF